jgi:membrane associated rhomboid family serine protease
MAPLVFLLPIGHDQPVYDRPWLTFGLIGLCTALFFVTATLDASALDEAGSAIGRMDAIAAHDPDARVTFTVEGLPERLDPIVRPLIDTSSSRRSSEGDAALGDAVRDAVAALNRVPTLRWGYRPGHPSVVRAFTSMFLHADFGHLAGNMLFLFVAGGVLECFWRRWAYLALYFGSGIAAVLAHTLADPEGLTPVIGASGAVAGLMGAFLVAHTQTKIRFAIGGLLYIPILHFKGPYAAGQGYLRFGSWMFGTVWIGYKKFDVRAWLVLPLWLALEITYAVMDPSSMVAHWAHVGGFVFGALVALLAKRMLWIAEDAGTSRDVGPFEPLALAPEPARPSRGRSVAALPSMDDLPLPVSRSVPPASSLPSRRPPIEAIELDSLPANDEDDPFER